MVNFIFALFCLAVVFFLVELTFRIFLAWLLFCAISWVLSLVGLQEYAWLVFIVFVLWSWFRY